MNWGDVRGDGPRKEVRYGKTSEDKTQVLLCLLVSCIVTVGKTGGATLKHIYLLLKIIANQVKERVQPQCSINAMLSILHLLCSNGNYISGEITVDHFRLPTMTSPCCHGSCHVCVCACGGETCFVYICIKSVNAHLCHRTAFQQNYSITSHYCFSACVHRCVCVYKCVHFLFVCVHVFLCSHPEKLFCQCTIHNH